MSADVESERTLLATMMLRPGDCWGIDIDARHFVVESHGEILDAMRALESDSQPSDPVSVADYLTSRKRPEIATLALRIASDALPTTMPAAFADRIRGAWRLRQARSVAAMLERATDAESIDDAVAALLGLHESESRHEWTAKAAVQSSIAKLQAQATGTIKTVPSGLRDLDRLLGGWHAGDLVVIGARPAMGKTSMALGMARHAASKGHAIGLVSGEQPVEQVADRLLALASGVPATHFRGTIEEAEWGRVGEAVTSTAALPLWVYDRSAPSVTEVIRVARRWVHNHKIEALFVDYLQRLDMPGDRRFEAVGAAVKSLKNLARDLNIPVIVLAQVSRQVEQRKPPEPRMGDLSDSSEIEKEADQVLLLYRDEQYHADSPKRGIAKIIIDKNRHGPTGFIECAFVGETMRFADLVRDEWEAA